MLESPGETGAANEEPASCPVERVDVKNSLERTHPLQDVPLPELRNVRLSRNAHATKDFESPPKLHPNSLNHYNPTFAEDDDDVFLDVVVEEPTRQGAAQPSKAGRRQLSRQQSIRLAARQLSTRTRTVARQMSVNTRTAFKRRQMGKPNTFFNFGLCVCFFCLSPLGLVAMVMATLAEINFHDGEKTRANKYRYAALGLSIAGIVTTLAIAFALLFTIGVRK